MFADYAFLFLPIFLYLGLPKSHGSVQVTYEKNEDNFIEDKNMTFVCRSSERTDIQSVWFVRDPRTKEKLFFRETNEIESSIRRGKRGMTKFWLIMRRDFAGKEVVCHNLKKEGKFRIPFVNRTIQVDEVIMTTKNLVVGDSVRLFCDVKANPGVVKNVLFRIKDATGKETSSYPLGNGWRRYEIFQDVALGMDKNGTKIQCVAVTVMSSSATGNVVSEVQALIMHYFHFKSPVTPKFVIRKGSSLRFFFKVSANPPPRREQFVLRRDLTGGREANVSKNAFNITVKVLTESQQFGINVNFSPQDPANYRLHFRSALLSNKSHAFNIDFLRVKFDGWRRTPWRSRVFLPGDLLPLSFYVLSNLRPSRNCFSVFHLDSRNARLGSAHIPSQTQVRPLRVANRTGLGIFYIEMFVVVSSSGTYRVFINLKGVRSESPVFQVGTKEAGIKQYIVLILLISVAMLIIFVFVFNYCRQKLKDSPQNQCLTCSKAKTSGSSKEAAENPAHDDPNGEEKKKEIASRPLELSVLIGSPKGKYEWKLIQCNSRKWSEIQRTIDNELQLFNVSEKTSVIISKGAIQMDNSPRKRNLRRGYNVEYDSYEYSDDAGQMVPDDAIRRLTWQFLNDSSTVPNTLRLKPHLLIRTGCKILKWEKVDNGTPKLTDGKMENLWDKEFVVLIEGIQCSNGNEQKYFWLFSDDRFAEQDTGRDFRDLGAIPSSANGEKHRIFVLHKDGDGPPEMKVPVGKFLTVWKKSGVKLQMKNRKIYRVEGETNADVWERAIATDDFQKEFTAAARRTKDHDVKEVSILLPNGIRFPFILAPKHKLPDIVAAARCYLTPLHISDIIWRGKSLTSCSGQWDEQGILAMLQGLASGEDLVILGRPDSISFLVTDSSGKCEWKSCELKLEEKWKDVREAAQKQLKKFDIREQSVVSSEGAIYRVGNEERHAVRGYNCESDNYEYFDQVDGKRIDDKLIRRFTVRFLRDSSLLPSAPGLQPHLLIRMNCKFFKMDGKEIVNAEPSDFWNSKFFAFFEGLRCDGDVPKYYWQLEDHRYVCPATGEEYPDKESVDQADPSVKSRAFVLLKDSDPPPPLQKFKSSKSLNVFRRFDTRQRMRFGQIRERTPPKLHNVECWEVASIRAQFTTAGAS